ncbi:MAG: GlsB/YeaQ/YmgE family stress response membrane protein [Candidatus Daviesbacteria bacterium]|nr:GlsB/YeaQ/YmgE family stress response membrane protein [Candidatus Daviesbacteria bacterium]
MNIITWIIFGTVTGIIANFLDPSPDQGGAIGSIILGILGGVLGGFLASLIFGIGISGFNISSFIIAITGSLMLLYASRVFKSTPRY